MRRRARWILGTLVGAAILNIAVALACVSILASFLWMPFYPVWSLTVIAFDVFVIWAVTAHGRDIARV